MITILAHIDYRCSIKLVRIIGMGTSNNILHFTGFLFDTTTIGLISRTGIAFDSSNSVIIIHSNDNTDMLGLAPVSTEVEEHNVANLRIITQSTLPFVKLSKGITRCSFTTIIEEFCGTCLIEYPPYKDTAPRFTSILTVIYLTVFNLVTISFLSNTNLGHCNSNNRIGSKGSASRCSCAISTTRSIFQIYLISSSTRSKSSSLITSLYLRYISSIGNHGCNHRFHNILCRILNTRMRQIRILSNYVTICSNALSSNIMRSCSKRSILLIILTEHNYMIATLKGSHNSNFIITIYSRDTLTSKIGIKVIDICTFICQHTIGFGILGSILNRVLARSVDTIEQINCCNRSTSSLTYSTITIPDTCNRFVRLIQMRCTRTTDKSSIACFTSSSIRHSRITNSILILKVFFGFFTSFIIPIYIFSIFIWFYKCFIPPFVFIIIILQIIILIIRMCFIPFIKNSFSIRSSILKFFCRNAKYGE